MIFSDFSSCRLSCRPAHVTNQELDGSPQSFGEKPKVFQGKKLPLLLVFWIFSEILLFTLILRSIGLLATLALALATSLLGLSNLRKLFKIQEKQSLNIKRDAAGLDAALAALADICLILPGFASDLLGLALKSPTLRKNFIQRIQQASSPIAERLIELSPQEWKIIQGRDASGS